MVLQTGGGKTQIASFMAKSATLKGKRVMFACHRDFLIEQTSRTFLDHGIRHTFIAAGEKYHPQEGACIASIDTLKNRIGQYDAPDLFICDEAIHAAANGWSNVINHFRNNGSRIIGLAACPHRGDGVGLGRWFDDMVVGPSMRELIDMGYLSDYKIYAPTGINRGDLHVRAGEFIKTEAEGIMNKPQITGSAIGEYKKFALGKQGIGFCVSIKHSQEVAEAFRADGISAAHIGSDTDKDDRRRMLSEFRQGKIKFLTSVDIFSEGFDLPVVEYAALLRPTKSLNTYRQQIGRILRKADGKDFARIADHASNFVEHGFPDDHIEWTLKDRDKREAGDRGEVEKKARTCPGCHYTSRPVPVCPNCGFVHPVEAREVEEVDGELVEIERQQAKKAARIEVGMAKTIADLNKIAEERGYKKAWVYKQMQIKGIRA
jgi:superfamily II DNA or RNA helicase